jgi:hypothetical protein
MFQPHTSSFGELGVQGQYLDSESNLVDDALTGRLHLRPQLQIAQGVVEAVTILVMNVFVLFKRATESFGHQHAMLIRLFAPSKMQPTIPRRMHVTGATDWAPFSAFPTAFFRAELLLHVVASVATIFSSAQVAFLSLATQLALKCRRRFVVHASLLHGWPTTVKEIV